MGLPLLPAVLLAGAVLPSCRTVDGDLSGRAALARADDALIHRNYETAIALYKNVAEGRVTTTLGSPPRARNRRRSRSARNATPRRSTTVSGERRAEALLGLGKAYTALGDHERARDALDRARRARGDAPFRLATDVARGELSFARRDYSAAYRILRPIADRPASGIGTGTRDRILLIVGVCAHKNRDHERGASYLASANVPASERRAFVLEHLPDYDERARLGWKRPSPPKARRQPPPKPTRSGPLQVLSRRDWGARSPRANKTRMKRPYRITIHHTAVDEPGSHSRRQAASKIQSIQKVHQKQRGWADIGYHYIIDRSGRVWEGRDIRYQGAHARGAANKGNIGIVLMGDFTRQDPTPAQTASLARFLDRVCSRYGLPTSRVYTHAEIVHGGTQCPGPGIARFVRRFRRDGLAMVTHGRTPRHSH